MNPSALMRIAARLPGCNAFLFCWVSTIPTAGAETGFILYPGKLTQLETFRVGCIGAIGPNEVEQAVQAVALALEDMGIASREPAI